MKIEIVCSILAALALIVSAESRGAEPTKSQQAAPSTAKPAAPSTSASSPAAPPPPQVPAGPPTINYKESLTSTVSDYVTKNPTASLSKVASFANSKIKEKGVFFDFVGKGGKVNLEAGDKQLPVVNFMSPQGCDLKVLPLPVRAINANSAEVMTSSGVATLTFNTEIGPAKGLVMDSAKKIIAELPVPVVLSPTKISNDGKTLFAPYLLVNQKGDWWTNVVKKDKIPSTATVPFLMLKISAKKIEFSSDPADYKDARQGASSQEAQSEDIRLGKFVVHAKPVCYPHPPADQKKDGVKK